MTRYEIDLRDELATVAVFGEIDISTAGEFESALDKALAGSNDVVIDLTETKFIDSTAIGVVIRAHKSARRSGNAVRLVCPEVNTPVTKVLNLLGVANLVAVHSDIEHAENPARR